MESASQLASGMLSARVPGPNSITGEMCFEGNKGREIGALKSYAQEKKAGWNQ